MEQVSYKISIPIGLKEEIETILQIGEYVDISELMRDALRLFVWKKKKELELPLFKDIFRTEKIMDKAWREQKVGFQDAWDEIARLGKGKTLHEVMDSFRDIEEELQKDFKSTSKFLEMRL